MRIVHLTPGTGNFHCGSCHRDHALVKALRAQGHDALMVPLYLPLVTDEPTLSPDAAVLAGGINVFLQEKLPLLRYLPSWARRFMDSPRLLLAAAKRASMTSARQLGEMTVGSLRGAAGRQRAEWQRVIDWVKTQQPDVLSLSNGLLSGLATMAQRDLGIPVVCSLQGEDAFLDTLPEPWRAQAWQLMRENATAVTRYVAASQYYADTMRARLQLAPERLVVVRNGIDLAGYVRQAAPPAVPTVGYLARQIHGKGLHVLVDAFILMAARLSIAGTKTPADEAFIAEQQNKLRAAGLWDRVTWRGELTAVEKAEHYRSLTVLSVPAIYGEAFGLYVVEALACGVPCVEPDHAGLGELVRDMQAGLLCEVDNPASLADALVQILTQPTLRSQYAESGYAAVHREYSAERMARDFLAAVA
jgi:glycosyltransferase involved in cell wall biosynthesis